MIQRTHLNIFEQYWVPVKTQIIPTRQRLRFKFTKRNSGDGWKRPFRTLVCLFLQLFVDLCSTCLFLCLWNCNKLGIKSPIPDLNIHSANHCSAIASTCGTFGLIEHHNIPHWLISMNTRACYVHAGSNKSEKMAILFEEWIKCSEDWSSSDFVVRFRESTTHRQQGSRRWMDKGEIVEKYSRGRSKEEAEAVAMEIINNKINSAPHAIRPNPDCPLNSAMKQYLVWDESFESDTTDHVVESLFEAKDRSKGSKAKKDKKRKKRKASSSSSSSSKSSKSDSSDSSSADKKKKKRKRDWQKQKQEGQKGWEENC